MRAQQGRLEPQARPVHQHPKVVLVGIETRRDLRPVGVFRQDQAQELAVFFREFIQNLADHLLALFSDDIAVQIDPQVGRFSRVLGQLKKAMIRTDDLENDVSADGVYEGGQACGVVEALARAEVAQHAEKRLLAGVVCKLGCTQLAARFHPDWFLKVRRELRFGVPIVVYKPVYILLVKTERFQSHPEWIAYLGGAGLRPSAVSPLVTDITQTQAKCKLLLSRSARCPPLSY
jgi:hypothetical protein